MSTWSIRACLLMSAVVVAPGLAAGCSCGDGGAGDTAAGGGDPGGPGSGSGGNLFPTGGGTQCQGLQCQQVECDPGVTTTITGTVYEPAGKVPLYNIAVYVPNAPLSDIVDGSSCDQCGSTLSGDPIVTTITDTQGRFVLENVPVGDDIPLVVQVGKWRRAFVIPKVEPCVETPTIDGTLRLPRNKTEGHIPKIALTTGGADPLECWLRKIGLEDSEFTLESGDGRVNLFAGPGGSDRFVGDGNPTFTPATSLWATTDSLRKYDIVLMACEGDPNPDQKQPAALQAMYDYLSLGGRVFASHWHNYWIQAGPEPFPQTAVFEFLADPSQPLTSLIDTSFPKGQALSDWLVNVEASTVPGEIDIYGPQHTIESVNPDLATRWIYSTSDNPEPGVQYFTFNTPLQVPEEEQCGRLVYSDIHVSAEDNVGQPFPDGCNTVDLSAQEKALLFMLFDLSACLTPDDEEPPVPE